MGIRVLDGETINKIAAGEVIERPANALKELLENSADSGATRIEIDFDGGGKKEIKVTDDGCGIPADEVALALERHATSKITSISDLDALYTFGFRGEALSALAAVSDLDLMTSSHETSVGTKIQARGGKILAPQPSAPLKGTQISIKNLFYNIPARQKFLKSDAGETAALKKIVRSFVLIHPELSVTLKQNGKVIGHWERETFKKRAQRILDITDEQSVYLKGEDGDLKIEGVIVLPQLSINTQSGISIFVQNRPITDKTIQQAILEGYRSLLMHHQYPQAVISIQMDPRNVDINVHPAKAQVKFLSPGTIFRFVSSEIKKALNEKMSSSSREEESTLAVREIQRSFIEDAVVQYNQRSYSVAETAQPTQSVQNSVVGIETAPKSEDRGIWSSVQVIGQFANTYIIGQSRNALSIIDQHAAHERVLFERLKKSWESGNIEKQGALIDDSLTLPREAIEALTSQSVLAIFEKMGFEIADRGPNTLSVSARPAFLSDIGLQPLFEKLSEQVLEMHSTGALEDLLGEIWASMACHGAIRAGRVLSREEMQALLSQMDEFSFSHFCPHGRPVSVQWNLYDLEKLFRRIV